MVYLLEWCSVEERASTFFTVFFQMQNCFKTTSIMSFFVVIQSLTRFDGVRIIINSQYGQQIVDKTIKSCSTCYLCHMKLVSLEILQKHSWELKMDYFRLVLKIETRFFVLYCVTWSWFGLYKEICYVNELKLSVSVKYWKEQKWAQLECDTMTIVWHR